MSLGQMIGGLVMGALAGSLINRGSGGAMSGGSSSPVPMAAQQPVPTLPKAPEEVKPDEDNAAAQAIKDAEEKEKQAALARRKGGQSVFTSPLGAAGSASVNRKQLLGE